MQYEIIVEVIIHIMLGQRSFSYFKYELQILGLLHTKDWQGHSEKVHMLTVRMVSCICDTHLLGHGK